MKPVELSPEARRAAAEALRVWLRDELEIEAGGLQLEMLVTHIADTMGPIFYNQGVADARAVVAARAEDTDEALYGLERATPLR